MSSNKDKQDKKIRIGRRVFLEKLMKNKRYHEIRKEAFDKYSPSRGMYFDVGIEYSSNDYIFIVQNGMYFTGFEVIKWILTTKKYIIDIKDAMDILYDISRLCEDNITILNLHKKLVRLMNIISKDCLTSDIIQDQNIERLSEKLVLEYEKDALSYLVRIISLQETRVC